MPAMLLEKKADLIPAVLPFALNPKLKADGKVLFTLKDRRMGKTQMIVWTARSRSSTRTAPRCRLHGGHVAVVRWFQDPKNHDAAAEIASKITKAPAAPLRLALYQAGHLSRPELAARLEALQRNIDTIQDSGFVKKHSTSVHSPTQPGQEAAKRLAK